jgi:hypothetical protein
MLLQINKVATTVEIMYDCSGRGKSAIQILIPRTFLFTLLILVQYECYVYSALKF